MGGTVQPARDFARIATRRSSQTAAVWGIIAGMDKPPAFTLHLVRHGETEWNAAGRWQGQTDVPLSAAGRAQASRLARRLAESGARFDALYSSDLARAWDTAVAIGGALGLTPAAAPDLREINLGTWAGKTHDQIAREHPDQWELLQRNVDFARGGGETFAELQQRVVSWMERTAGASAGLSICAVTHGGCIRAVLLHALGLTWADRHRVPPIGNGSISILERAPQGWRFVRTYDPLDLTGPPTEETDWEET